MDRTQIVGILNFMADLFDLEPDNPFRSRSYRSGARAREALTGDLKELVDSGELTGVKGIGESIAAVIADLLETGTTARREELLEAEAAMKAAVDDAMLEAKPVFREREVRRRAE